MNIKSFLKTTSIILLFNALIKITWVLGIEVTVQNRFGVQDYGTYYSILSLSYFFSFLLDFGISKYQSVSMTQETGSNRQGVLLLLELKGWLTLGYLIMSVLGGVYFRLSTPQLVSLLALCFCQVFLSYILFIRSTFSGLGQFFWEGLLSILDRSIMIVVCALWLLLPWFFPKIKEFIWIQFFGYACSLAVAASALIRLLKSRPAASATLSASRMKILYLTFPFAYLASLEIINDRIGILALGKFLADGAEQVGWYAYGQRWLDAFKMFASLVGIVLLTYYARLLQTPQKLISLIKFCLLGIFLPISVISIVACLNTTYLTTKLYHSSSDYLSTIFMLNILSFVPYSIIYIFHSLFLANGGIKRLNIIFTMGLVINVILSLLLIKSYKAVGVSISFLASASVIAFLQIVFSPVKIKFISIAKFGVKTVFILSSTAAICYLLSNSGIFLQLVAGMVWAMGLVWFLNLFSLSFWHEVRDSVS